MLIDVGVASAAAHATGVVPIGLIAMVTALDGLSGALHEGVVNESTRANTAPSGHSAVPSPPLADGDEIGRPSNSRAEPGSKRPKPVMTSLRR